MTGIRLSALALLGAAAIVSTSAQAQDSGTSVSTDVAPQGATKSAASSRFHAPVRLETVDGEYVRTEAPGYASPTCFDVDGDGKKDLVVGQFHKGKIKVYRNRGEGKLAKGEWLKTGDEIALVPDVW